MYIVVPPSPCCLHITRVPSSLSRIVVAICYDEKMAPKSVVNNVSVVTAMLICGFMKYLFICILVEQ